MELMFPVGGPVMWPGPNLNKNKNKNNFFI